MKAYIFKLLARFIRAENIMRLHEYKNDAGERLYLIANIGITYNNETRWINTGRVHYCIGEQI